MQLTGRPKADVERALMSRLDFAATDVASTLFSAAYLARFGAKEQALKLYRQASDLEPTRPESYVLGLRLARELKDYAAVQWAATGVLQSVWSKDYEQLHREAEDAALDAERALPTGRQGIAGRRAPGRDGAGPDSRSLRASAVVRRRRSRPVRGGAVGYDGFLSGTANARRRASIGTTATAPTRRTATKSTSARSGCRACTWSECGGSTARSSATGHS